MWTSSQDSNSLKADSESNTPSSCLSMSKLSECTYIYKLEVVVTQSCPTLYYPMDCSPPGSSVSGIPRASILEWVAIPYSRDLPDPGIKPASLSSPALAGGFSTTEPLGKPQKQKFTALEETLAVLFLPPSVPN